MGEKQEKQRKQFEVISQTGAIGFARARFGGMFGNDPVRFAEGLVADVTGPVSFAPVEDNAGFPPEEYFACNARMLSKAVTPYRKFDFTKDNVLKDAVPIFEGLTLYANHWIDVENWKGKTQNAVWDDKNKPNGINCLVLADRIVDPKLARGLETKALRSFSVTIWFKFEKSHPDLPGFWDRLGEEVDGQVVRMIVTEITNAAEFSVVWEGEDPYAKSFESGLGATGTGHEENHNPKEGDMKLTATLLALVGLAAGAEPTAEELETKIREKFQPLETKITTLETEIANLKPNAILGEQLLTDTRDKAATIYKTVKGEKFQQTFIDGVIQKADLATARALLQEYEEAVDKSVPLKCAKCGETLSRRSSVPENPAGQLSKKDRIEDYQKA